MEVIREKRNGCIAQGNQDDNYYKLKEKGKKLMCIEAEVEVPQLKVNKLDEDNHEVMLQEFCEDTEELKMTIRENNKSLLLLNNEINIREDLISKKNEENAILRNNNETLEKSLRDKKMENEQIKNKLSRSQENTQNKDIYILNLQERLQNNTNEKKLLEGHIKEVEEQNQKLIKQIDDKDILMTEDKQKIKEQMDEIMANKKLQQSQIMNDNLYLFIIVMLLILIFTGILIYLLSTYSWYHPGTIIMTAAIGMMIIKLLITGKDINIWYNKYKTEK
ncbi:intracellular protein transport protein USO1-like [Anneissia japonica]|uniref:intracellular protein transport protein USO1-like n=1 Tax=Anneissia japonica TaxID=1529436 RepID=UPI0014255BF4|nr:intracellular protein transport protein USO1-like [Anneissia japonica]